MLLPNGLASQFSHLPAHLAQNTDNTKYLVLVDQHRAGAQVPVVHPSCFAGAPVCSSETGASCFLGCRRAVPEVGQPAGCWLGAYSAHLAGHQTSLSVELEIKKTCFLLDLQQGESLKTGALITIFLQFSLKVYSLSDVLANLHLEQNTEVTGIHFVPMFHPTKYVYTELIPQAELSRN